MANPKKSLSSLPTGAVELAQICGLTAPMWIKWKYREDISAIFKKYNRSRGKMSKSDVIQQLSKIPVGEYGRPLKKLMDYVENYDY